MLPSWPSRPDGQDTDSEFWPGRKDDATTSELVWRFLDRSVRTRLVVSSVLALLPAFVVEGITYDETTGAEGLGPFAWGLFIILIAVPLSYIARTKVIQLAARAEAEGARLAEPVESTDGEEGPLPPGARVIDYSGGGPVLAVASLAVGAVAAALLPGKQGAGPTVVDALLIAAAIFCVGAAVALVTGRAPINDGIVADAFRTRGQATFYRALTPLLAGLAYVACVYVAERREWVSQTSAEDLYGYGFIGFAALWGLLAAWGKPAALVPHFMRALGAPRTVWDAVPDPPYGRKARKRSRKR